MHEYISNGQFKNNRTIARIFWPDDKSTVISTYSLEIHMKSNCEFDVRHDMFTTYNWWSKFANFDLNGCSMADKTVRWNRREKKRA